jgi:hypothetical protein
MQPRPWIQKITDLEIAIAEIESVNKRLLASYHPTVMTSHGHIDWLMQARKELCDRAVELGGTSEQLDAICKNRIMH